MRTSTELDHRHRARFNFRSKKKSPFAMIHSNVRPMTLGNMRANGVGSLLVYCFACHHEVVFGVEDYPDDVPVPAFSPRMVCTRCGMIGADARPNWSERR
jgi:hypothetical protein